MIRFIATLAVVFCAAANAHAVSAGIISVNDPVFGVGSLTRDTSQNLDFLDVDLAAGRSFDDVAGQFGPGGDFEGFRYATQEEVGALVMNWGFSPDPVLGGLVVGNTGGDQLSGLIDLLGYTIVNFDSGSGSQGSRNATLYTGTLIPSLGKVRVTSLDDFIDPTDNDRVRFDIGIPPDHTLSHVGHALVRSSSEFVAVPEPTSLAAVLLGLATLARRRRKFAADGCD